mgnify:CR=1 FL=1
MLSSHSVEILLDLQLLEVDLRLRFHRLAAGFLDFAGFVAALAVA